MKNKSRFSAYAKMSKMSLCLMLESKQRKMTNILVERIIQISSMLSLSLMKMELEEISQIDIFITIV